MFVNQKNNQVNGRTHVIKLNQKEVRINLRYQSPQKQQIQKQSIQISIKKINLSINNQRKRNFQNKDANASGRRQKQYFYKSKIQEINHLNEYEQFHQKFNQINKYKLKINVVSKSKERQSKIIHLKQSKKKILNTINKENQVNQYHNFVPIRKIVLFSPQKKKKVSKQIIKNDQNSNKILKTHDKFINKVIGSEINPYLRTPQKRRFKIQVTSSKRHRSKIDVRIDDEQLQLKINKLQNNLHESTKIKYLNDSISNQH